MKLAAGSCLRSPYPSPTATEVLGLAASCPPCCATPGAAGHWLGRSWKLPAGCGLSSSRITRRSSAGPGVCLHDVAQTPARLAPPGQSLSAGRAVPGALLEEPGSIPCHPALAGTSTAGDTALPARGIPHRAEPGLWARDVAPVGADALCWCPFPSRPALCTSPSVPATAWALFPQSFHG